MTVVMALISWNNRPSKWWLISLLITACWLPTLRAEVPFYTIALEWPLDSAYSLDVQNITGTKLGITVTPAFQYKGKHTQVAIIVPALAACNSDTTLHLTINALHPQQTANLRITQVRDVIYQQDIATALEIDIPGIPNDACKQQESEIIGELSIAVVKTENGVTLNWDNLIAGDVGHAWIEFRALTPDVPIAYATAGTYNSIVGDNVVTGINFFREIYRPADIRKTIPINAEQLAAFIDMINQYVSLGTSSWTPWHNCTAFAIDAWQAATGETLSATVVYENAPWEVTQMGFPNTTSLYYSILAAQNQ